MTLLPCCCGCASASPPQQGPQLSKPLTAHGACTLRLVVAQPKARPRMLQAVERCASRLLLLCPQLYPDTLAVTNSWAYAGDHDLAGIEVGGSHLLATSLGCHPLLLLLVAQTAAAWVASPSCASSWMHPDCASHPLPCRWAATMPRADCSPSTSGATKRWGHSPQQLARCCGWRSPSLSALPVPSSQSCKLGAFPSKQPAVQAGPRHTRSLALVPHALFRNRPHVFLRTRSSRAWARTPSLRAESGPACWRRCTVVWSWRWRAAAVGWGPHCWGEPAGWLGELVAGFWMQSCAVQQSVEGRAGWMARSSQVAAGGQAGT